MNQLVKFDNAEVLAPDELVNVYIRRSPLRQHRDHIQLQAGLSIDEIVSCCGLEPVRLHVSIGGHVIDPKNWARVRVKPGVSVVIVKVPGKGALRAIAGLVISIFAAVLAGPLSAILLPGLVGTTAGMVATGVIGAGLSLGGCLAIGILSGDEEILYMIGGPSHGR